MAEFDHDGLTDAQVIATLKERVVRLVSEASTAWEEAAKSAKDVEEAHTRGLLDARARYAQAWKDVMGWKIQEVLMTPDLFRRCLEALKPFAQAFRDPDLVDIDKVTFEDFKRTFAVLYGDR